MFNGALYSTIVWPDVAHARQLTWMAVIATMAAVRLMLRAVYRRRPRTTAEMPRWTRLWMLGALGNGLAWGSMALYAYPHDSLSAQMLQTIVLAAAVGVAGSISASHPPSYFAFALPTVGPLIVRELIHADMFHVIMALLVLLNDSIRHLQRLANP